MDWLMNFFGPSGAMAAGMPGLSDMGDSVPGSVPIGIPTQPTPSVGAALAPGLESVPTAGMGNPMPPMPAPMHANPAGYAGPAGGPAPMHANPLAMATQNPAMGHANPLEQPMPTRDPNYTNLSANSPGMGAGTVPGPGQPMDIRPSAQGGTGPASGKPAATSGGGAADRFTAALRGVSGTVQKPDNVVKPSTPHGPPIQRAQQGSLDTLLMQLFGRPQAPPMAGGGFSSLGAALGTGRY